MAGKTTKTGAAEAKAPRANSAFMKPMQPDEALAQVVGSQPLPRTEVTKKLWEYVRKHKLQDANDKRTIVADDKLKPIFGGKASVTMFEMTKLVNAHLKDPK